MFIILFFEIFLNIKIILNNSVVFPFKECFNNYNKLNKKSSYAKILLDNYLEYKIYSEIKIGTPSKTLPLFINSNIKIFRMKFEEQIPNFDLNKYDKYVPLESSSFINITNLSNLEEFYFFGYSLINETIKLCKNKNCNDEIEIKNIQLYSETKKDILNDKYSYSIAEIGIPFSKSTDYQSDILNELKNFGIINSTIITFEYNDNKNGNIYIGEYPHIYDYNNYDKNLLMTAYSIPNYSINNQIKIRMDKIYISYENTNSVFYLENNNILFNFGSGIILSTEEYYNKILEIYFNKYINLNICEIHTEKRGFNNNYQIISCQKREEFKINEFPTLYLFKEEFKYIFELNYLDLFEEIGNKYYFLIINFPFSNNNFELGKPFLKKYQMSYNVDMSTIHFYRKLDKNNKDNFENTIKDTRKKLIILFNLIILLCLLIFVFYKKVFHKKRKLRKNEIKEDNNYEILIDDNN